MHWYQCLVFTMGIFSFFFFFSFSLFFPAIMFFYSSPVLLLFTLVPTEEKEKRKGISTGCIFKASLEPRVR